MIGYVTLGTNDLAIASAFYDSLLLEIGARRLWAMERGVAWGVAPDKPSLGVLKPYNGEAATAGNGTMVSLVVNSPELVDRLHAKALALGAADEGAAGPRSPSFYAAYFRDPDGNKICVFCMGAPVAK